MKVDLVINDLKKLQEIYNLDKDIIIRVLEVILREKFNFGEIFIKNNRVYELLSNSSKLKQRKIRLTKRNINIILNELKKRLLKISKQNKKKQILNQYFLQVIKGQIIGKNQYCYQVKFDNNIGFLYFNRTKKNYRIGDVDYFHINKIKLNDKELTIILDDTSKQIVLYKIYAILQGLYINKIDLKKDKVIIYSNSKVPKRTLDEIKLLTGKQAILKEIK